MSEPPHIPEELIELKAYQIRKKRQLDGREGTPSSDWEKAKRYLEEHRWEVRQWKFFRRITLWWETTCVENFLEDVEYLLQNSAFLSIINLVAGITIIVILITWGLGIKERRENEIFLTWQVVNDASEDQSGVVKIALERLWRNRFSLRGLMLKNTNLWKVDLQKANLSEANLQKANLSEANLQKANLWGVNLHQASLWGANLQQARLGNANLQQALLESANLQRASLVSANLQQALLMSANLQQADLDGADLQQASLWGANLQQANLECAENLSYKQIKSACFWGEAIYKGEWSYEKKVYVAIEPDNKNFIEELKNDTASDPEEPPDCSRWGN